MTLYIVSKINLGYYYILLIYRNIMLYLVLDSNLYSMTYFMPKTFPADSVLLMIDV